jgi:hypothetical protein
LTAVDSDAGCAHAGKLRASECFSVLENASIGLF